MKSILNQLIQLQELNFAKEEQKASNSKEMPLAQLEKSIAEIRRQLPAAVARAADHRKQTRCLRLAVIPLAHGSCSRRCGLAGAPGGIVNAVKAGETTSKLPALRVHASCIFQICVARQPKKKYDRGLPVRGRHQALSSRESDGAQVAATTRGRSSAR